ncbi:MAG: UDP-glucose 6-dehydrogenase, partial [Candidatus Hodarchaeota archaeon]
MHLTIFGAGYVGLSTAVCFAKRYQVSLVDIDYNKVMAIKNNEPVIYETGLDALLEEGLRSGRLKIYHILDRIPQADIIFITVGTPSDHDGYINLQYVRDIVKTIKQLKSELLNPKYSLIVIRSTVIPGTTSK